MGASGGRLREIFQEVVDLAPAERERVLRERCGGDDDLLRRVRGLLEADARATNPVLAAGVGERPGEIVGPYRIVRLLGEGGMGAVHLAEQTEPVRRLVALKRIRPGSHGAVTQARFEAERQILAQLDHPAIARVLDAGTTSAGLPWFAMEYVEGLPLLEACDRARLGLGERLRLFLEVCDGVQHAHGKGVVHCDLSPRNVLVQEVDGRRRPKLIDFGIARVLTVSSAAEGELATDRPVGTWRCMSPEQLDPRGRRVDTRADVYALGSLLYELLAGAPPFDSTRLAELPPEEARRVLAEEEPPAPSARVAGLGTQAAVAAAGARRLTPRGLARELAGDLDWIVARAMAKDRDARYSTVAELSLDLRRHLAHEPVDAAPRRAGYRAGKFVRRHAVGVAVAAGVALALVLGLVAVDAARRRASAAEAEAERRRAIVEREREEAEAVVTLVQQGLFHVGGPAAGSGHDGPPDAHDLLELAASDAATLYRGRPHAEAAARHMLGRAFLALGDARRAQEELLAAYALQQRGEGDDPVDVLGVLESLVQATSRAEGVEAARKWVRRALEVGETALRRDDPSFVKALEPLLGLTAGLDVPAADAERAFTEVEARLARMNVDDPLVRPLARLFWEAGEVLRTRRGAADAGALEALERLGRDLFSENDLRYPNLLLTLAQSELAAADARPDVATRLARGVLERTEGRLAPDHWLRVEALHTLGAARLAAGDLEGAEGAFLEARFLAAGVQGRTAAHEQAAGGLRELAAFLLLPATSAARRGAFLEGSFGRWSAAHAPTGWWPVTWPEVPAELVGAATRWLEERGLAPAQRARGLVRLGRAAEALPLLVADDPETRAFRALALAALGRRDDAHAELAQAERDLAAGAQASAAWPVLRDEALRR